MVTLEGVVRRVLAYGLSDILPVYIVTEYPKSGGTWMSQLVAEYLGIPHPRNRVAHFESCVLQSHLKYMPTMANTVVVHRDGRDIMVSYYYYCLVPSPISVKSVVRDAHIQMGDGDFSDVARWLPRFIEYKFQKREHPRFTWTEFIDSWRGRGVTHARYEDLLADTVGELTRVLELLGCETVDQNRVHSVVEKYAFGRQTGRSPGTEKKGQFLRKGIAGDWRNVFNKEACEIFDHYAGKYLIELGYEQDHSWVR